jgi:uncharacterized protein YraI
MRIVSAFLLLALLAGLAIFLTFSSSWGVVLAPQVQEAPTAVVEDTPTSTPDWSGKIVVEVTQPVVVRTMPMAAAEVIRVLRNGDLIALTGCDADVLWCETEEGDWLLAYMVENLPGELPILENPGLTVQDVRIAPAATEEAPPTPEPTVEPTPVINLLQLLPTATPTPSFVETVVKEAANLRSGPGTTYDLTGSVAAGETIRLAGKSTDGSWYRLEDGVWIAAFLVEAPTSDLPIVEVEDAQ